MRLLKGLGLPSQQPWGVFHHSFKNVTLFTFKLSKTESFGVIEDSTETVALGQEYLHRGETGLQLRNAPELTDKVQFTGYFSSSLQVLFTNFLHLILAVKIVWKTFCRFILFAFLDLYYFVLVKAGSPIICNPILFPAQCI